MERIKKLIKSLKREENKDFYNDEIDKVFINSLNDFCKSKMENIYVLSSENGSGKTTLIKNFLSKKKFSRHITLSMSNMQVTNNNAIVTFILAHFYNQLVLKSKVKVFNCPKYLSQMEILIRVIVFAFLGVTLHYFATDFRFVYYFNISFFLLVLFSIYFILMFIINLIYQQIRFWKIEKFNIKLVGFEVNANHKNLNSEELLLNKKIINELRKYDFIIIEDIDRILKKQKEVEHIYATLTEIIDIFSVHNKNTKFIFLLGSSNLAQSDDDLLKQFGKIHFYKQKKGAIFYTNEILQFISKFGDDENKPYFPTVEFTYVYKIAKEINDLRELNSLLANIKLQFQILKPTNTDIVEKIIVLELIKMKHSNYYHLFQKYLETPKLVEKTELDLILEEYKIKFSENDLLLFVDRGFSINDDKFIGGENSYLLDLNQTDILTEWIFSDNYEKDKELFVKRFNQSMMIKSEDKYRKYIDEVVIMRHENFEYLFDLYDILNKSSKFNCDVYFKFLNLAFEKAVTQKNLDLKLYKLFYEIVTKLTDSELEKLNFINTYNHSNVVMPRLDSIFGFYISGPDVSSDEYADEYHEYLMQKDDDILGAEEQFSHQGWRKIYQYLLIYFYFMSRSELANLKIKYIEDILLASMYWNIKDYKNSLSSTISADNQMISKLSKSYDFSNIEKNFYNNNFFRVFIETELISDEAKKEFIAAIGLNLSISEVQSLKQFPVVELLIEKGIIFTDDIKGDINREKANELMRNESSQELIC